MRNAIAVVALIATTTAGAAACPRSIAAGVANPEVRAAMVIMSRPIAWRL